MSVQSSTIKVFQDNLGDMIAIKDEALEVAEVAQNQLKEYTQQFENASANMKKHYEVKILEGQSTINCLVVSLLAVSACAFVLAFKALTKCPG